MTNKEFINLLNQEYELVLAIIKENSHPGLDKMLGAFRFASRVTDNNYAKITALYNIMKKHPELADKQITDCIKGKQNYKFLSKFIDLVPNALESLKQKGPIKMAEEYSTIDIRKSVEKFKAKSKPKPKQEEEKLDDDGIFVDDTDDWVY